MSEWISRADVKTALRKIALTRMTGAAEDAEDYDVATVAYTDVSGEAAAYAKDNIEVAIAFLVSSVQTSVRDPGLAALVQSGVQSLHRDSSQIESQIRELTSRIEVSGPAVAEHHGSDAEAELERILSRRASPHWKPTNALIELGDAVRPGGRYAAAPNRTKAKIYDWLARMAAADNNLVVAHGAIADLRHLGLTPTPSTSAWLLVASGSAESALRMLRAIDTAEARTSLLSILRKTNGSDAALAYFDSLEKATFSAFTTIGWANAVSILAEKGRVEDAVRYVDAIPQNAAAKYPMVDLLAGVLFIAKCVSANFRERFLRDEDFDICDHLLEDPVSKEWLRRAGVKFDLARTHATANGDDQVEARASMWARWVRLVTEETKREEIMRLKQDLETGSDSLSLLPLALAFGVQFDHSSLERQLERAQLLGGLSPQQLQGRLLLLQIAGKFSDLASYISTNWARLTEIADPRGVAGMLIQSYAEAGECAKAEEAFNANRSLLHPLDVPRFQLMIAHCRGEAPSRLARENYEASGTAEDLRNLINVLEGMKRWGELEPYLYVLFQNEPNALNARRYLRCLSALGANAEKVDAFLAECDGLIGDDPIIGAARARAKFRAGRFAEALALNNTLLATRSNHADLALDINLAVRMADWERLPAILDRIWSDRSSVPCSLLLHLARLTAYSTPDRALEIVDECVQRDPEDVEVLMRAYAVASSLGRDDIAMPLIHKAAAMSDPHAGPVRTVSFREVVDMVRESAEDWSRKNALFREGAIPLHWASRIFNVPLSRMLIAVPRENKRESDARRRQPIPIRAGARQIVNMDGVTRLAVDITSLIILAELGLLDKTAESVSKIVLSPRLMEALAHEEDRVRFHQPSRVQAAKPLLELRRRGLLLTVTSVAPQPLVDEVGNEQAALLTVAQNMRGIAVHCGEIFRVGSYMDESAELGQLATCLSNPLVIVRMLEDEGLITHAQFTEASTWLERVGASSSYDAKPARDSPIFLDRVTAQYLAQLGVLTYLTNSTHRVYLHASAFEEWEALVDTEPHSREMLQVLESIRSSLKRLIAAGKVDFLKEDEAEELDETPAILELPVLDLLNDVDGVDAVCIDDRFLNAQVQIQDRAGKHAMLVSSLDVVQMLVSRLLLTGAQMDQLLHEMRERMYSLIPVDAERLLAAIDKCPLREDGQLIESAEVRVLREYLGRMHSSDFMSFKGDLPFLDELWRIGLTVVAAVWSSRGAATEQERIARANWVMDNVTPDIALAVRFLPDGQKRAQSLAASRLVAFLSPIDVPDDLIDAHASWLNDRVVAPLIPALDAAVQEAADVYGRWLVNKASEIADEVRSRNSAANR